MRPIKFRARDKYGETFYGSFDEDTCTIDCWDIAETVVVERDTVAQLVGYDKDGREVYEGDIVEFKSSKPGDRASQRLRTATVGLRPEIYADGKDYSKKLLRYKLKEAEQ